MGYCLVLTLDADLNKQVSDIWHVFEKASIGKTPGQLSEPPHITLAISSDDSPDGLWKAAADIVPPNNQVTLIPFGAFLAEKSILYFNAILSEGLRKVHRDIYSNLIASSTSTDFRYAPENVIFHCTIAIEIEPNRLPDAVALLTNYSVMCSGYAVTIELWEFFPVKILKSKGIF